MSDQFAAKLPDAPAGGVPAPAVQPASGPDFDVDWRAVSGWFLVDRHVPIVQHCRERNASYSLVLAELRRMYPNHQIRSGIGTAAE